MLKEFKRFDIEKCDSAQLSNFIEEMKGSLEELTTNLNTQVKGRELIISLIKEQGEEGFLGIILDGNVPGEERVLFWYTPTYIAAAFMMRYMSMYPDVAENINGYKETLRKALKASTGRGFNGKGYDGIKGSLEAVDIFKMGGVVSFIEKHPDFCPVFTQVFNGVIIGFTQALKTGQTKGDWGQEYKEQMEEAIKGFKDYNGTLIFVYGTLMQGRSNHKAYLSRSNFIATVLQRDTHYLIWDTSQE